VVYTYSGILLGLKRKEIVTYTATWTDLEDIMLGMKVSYKKDKCCVIPLM
jgi:hypothetical protein